MSLISSRPFTAGFGSPRGASGRGTPIHCSSLVRRVSMSRMPWKYSSSLAWSFFARPRWRDRALSRTASRTLRFCASWACCCSIGVVSFAKRRWNAATGPLSPPTGLPLTSQAIESPGPWPLPSPLWLPLNWREAKRVSNPSCAAATWSALMLLWKLWPGWA